MGIDGNAITGDPPDKITFGAVDGVIIWVGQSRSAVAAIVWAEDSGGLVYVPNGVLPSPASWRPMVGDVVLARVLKDKLRRKAFSMRLLVPATQTQDPDALARALKQLTGNGRGR